MNDLRDRLEFFVESGRLKRIGRANWVREEERCETVAEHVWHATLLAMLFADAAPAGIDHDRVRDLLTVHDLVEVYGGDTPILDQHDMAAIEAREYQAGERLIALLPADSRERLDSLWREFQAQATAEARFARAIDALHPMVVSWYPPSIGHARRNEITPSLIVGLKQNLIGPYPKLWQLAEWLILQAVEQGFISADAVSDEIARELNGGN